MKKKMGVNSLQGRISQFSLLSTGIKEVSFVTFTAQLNSWALYDILVVFGGLQ